MEEVEKKTSFNELHFEKLLFKEVSSNPATMSMLVDKLSPNVFTNEVLKAAYAIYLKWWNRWEHLPNKEELKLIAKDESIAKTIVEAHTLVKNVDVSSFEAEYQDTFFHFCEVYIRKRLSILVLNQVITDFQNNRLDADKAVERFGEVASLKLIQDLGFDIYEDVDKFIDQTKDEGGRIPTGFTDIDIKIGGGIPSKGKFLGVVSAPTNMGKSIFLGNLAVNAAKQGKNVLVVTLEMSETVYASRIYSALYGMKINELPFNLDELKQRVENQRYGDVLIKEFPPGTLTVDELSGYIESAIKGGKKFDLVCVDYLTLLAAPGSDNTNEAGKTISRKLRALSYKFECPFFTAAQINRDGFGLTPDMKYMAESIAICSESDLILSLYRQEEDVELSFMRVYFLKSRLGEKDVSSKLYFNTACLRFEDVPEDAQKATATPEATKATIEENSVQNSLADLMGF